MAKVVTYKCDRCKQRFDYDAKELRNRELELDDHLEGDMFDLCPECYQSLYDWFNGGDIGA